LGRRGGGRDISSPLPDPFFPLYGNLLPPVPCLSIFLSTSFLLFRPPVYCPQTTRLPRPCAGQLIHCASPSIHTPIHKSAGQTSGTPERQRASRTLGAQTNVGCCWLSGQKGGAADERTDGEVLSKQREATAALPVSRCKESQIISLLTR